MQACVRFNLLIRPCPNCLLQLEPSPQALSSPSASVLCKTHKQHRCACRNLNRPQAHPRYSFKKVPSGVCLAVVVLLCETLAGLSFPPKIVKTRATVGGRPHSMSAKSGCSPNQMGVRWPPLFGADLFLQRVNRRQAFFDGVKPLHAI